MHLSKYEIEFAKSLNSKEFKLLVICERKPALCHTPPIAHNLRELLDYVEAHGFSWPIHAQTIIDWVGAAAAHCGLPGQRMRLIHARCFRNALGFCRKGADGYVEPGANPWMQWWLQIAFCGK
jgi:hypothetical protein